MQPCRGIAWRTHRDDDNHGRQVVYAAQLKLHRIDRSLCPENPRPKGGINSLRPNARLIFTLNQNMTTLKTAWTGVRARTGVKGRLHDSRHTLVTELAENGASDQIIMDIAGHVSRQMLKHYSHIRMQAKREALEAVWKRPEESRTERKEQTLQDYSLSIRATPVIEGESLQNRGVLSKQRSTSARKPLKRFGSSGRIRTYNPSVNSRMLYH